MKEFFRDALYFIALAIAGKVITDSLPDIGVKKLWRYSVHFCKLTAGVFAAVAFVTRFLFQTLGKAPHKLQHLYLSLVAFVAAIVVIQKLLVAQQQGQFSTKKPTNH